MNLPQLACGQDGQLKGFAVLEYETAEMAEAAQERADGLALGGSHLRVSFCAPGPPGRSMLAALIAAQATVSRVPLEYQCLPVAAFALSHPLASFSGSQSRQGTPA